MTLLNFYINSVENLSANNRLICDWSGHTPVIESTVYHDKYGVHHGPKYGYGAEAYHQPPHYSRKVSNCKQRGVQKKFMLKVQNQRDISDQFIYFLRLLDIFLDERKSLISLMISFMFWIGPL